MQFNKHIFLTGFMGSGKSTISKNLAIQLKLDVIDLDVFIEQSENTSIEKIFDTKGELFFRDLETAYLNKITSLKKPYVIALGGGTVCFNNNLQIIKNYGVLLYIQLPVATLFKRLQKTTTQRPLIKNLSTADLKKFIELKLEERKPFYEQADVILNGLTLSPHSIAYQLIDFQKKDN